jgi:hypothetical protein
MLGTRSSCASSAWRRVCGSSARARAGQVELGDVHQHHGGVAAGGGGDHVARVLLVARRVGDDELARRRGEVAVGHVDGDALLALGLQAVGQQAQVDAASPLAAARACSCAQLVGQDGAAVEQQAADQRALAVVDAAGGQEAQRGCACAGRVAMPGPRAGWRGVHQK